MEILIFRIPYWKICKINFMFLKSAPQESYGIHVLVISVTYPCHVELPFNIRHPLDVMSSLMIILHFPASNKYSIENVSKHEWLNISNLFLKTRSFLELKLTDEHVFIF